MTSASSHAAALGFSVHTGWAQGVAVSGPLSAPKLLHRGRIDIAPGAQSVEVFHVAAEMELVQAKRHVERCTKAATEKASSELTSLMKALGAHVRSVAVGVVVGTAVLPPFDAILRSHLQIHSAEGQLFRRVILDAARDLELKSLAVRSKDLTEAGAAALKIAPQRLPQWLTDYGRTVGRPWGRDEKDAFLVACLALAKT